MHIVAIANFYGPRSGGLRTCLQQLGRGYRAAGHAYTAVVPGERNTVSDNDFGRVYTVRGPRVPGTGGYRVVLRRQLVVDLLSDLQPDRLEISDRTTLHGLAGWARRHRVPTVFYAHERVDGVLRAVRLPGWAAARLADLRNRQTARSFDAVVATTAFAAGEFDRIGAGVHRIPLGVDLDAFRPGRDADDLVPVASPARLLLCSRLSVEKRPELALQTVAELLRRNVSVHLTIAGDGPRRTALERAAGELPVRFLGFVTDRRELAGLLAGADVLLAPGPIETFGLAALEALASGTPAVVNAASALPEVIGDDPAAGAAAAGPVQFADAVQRLLAIPRTDRRLAARRRAERFPWSVTTAALLRLHEDLGAPTSAPSGTLR